MRNSKRIIRLIFVFAVGALFTSCTLFLARKQGFTVYKKPIITQEASKIPIQYDGFYFADNYPDGIIFYKNGLCKWITEDSSEVESNLRSAPEKGFAGRLGSKEWWGCYKIAGDTILVQDFNNHNTDFYKRWVGEKWFLVENNTKIRMFRYKIDYQKYDSQENRIYSFIPTSIKPDSSRAWFLNKKWYQKNLDESRKPY